MNIKKNQIVENQFTETIAISVLAALLAIPGILSAKDISKIINENKTYFNIVRVLNQKANKKYNNWSEATIANVVARTLWYEARGEGQQGLKYVASVIYNRAGGKTENLAKVCLKRKQFSCWNTLPNSQRTATGFTENFKLPSAVKDSDKNIKIWKYCMQLAVDMIENKFVPINKFINSYHTNSVTPSWSSSLTHVVKIKNHKFGYLKNYDGYTTKSKNSSQQIYKVKNGDTLSKIAKANQTTIEQLKKINNITNPNKIYIGQKIKLY